MTRFKINKKSHERVIKQIQKEIQKVASNIKITLMLRRNFQTFSSINIIISSKVIKAVQNTAQAIASNIKVASIFRRISQISSASYIIMLLTSKLKSVNANIIDSNINIIKSSFNVFMNNISMTDVVSESVNYESKDDDDVNILIDNKQYSEDENTNL